MQKLTQYEIESIIYWQKKAGRDVDFSSMDLRGVILIGASLEGANLSGAILLDANLEGANLRYANLSYANLRYAILLNANLRGAILLNANLIGAILSYANLICAILRGADLRCANLSGAILSYASLSGAILWGVRGNNKEIKSAHFLRYDIAWTEDRLQIGCKNHSIEEWESFDDDTIKGMSFGALEFWKGNKELIMAMVKHGK